MNHAVFKIALLAAGLVFAASGAARADCESDLLQLEAAFQSPNLSTDAKAALEAAKTKAVAALKKDDDATCHAAVAEGLTKAGIKIK
jgi:hypothetical protein